MKMLGSVSKISTTALKSVFGCLALGFCVALILEVQVTHDPWWTRVKDLFLLLIALWAAYRQIITDSLVSFFDGSDPEGTPVESENVYSFHLRIKRPLCASVEIVDCNTSQCIAELARSAEDELDDQEATQVACSATLRSDDTISLATRLPSASQGQYHLYGTIALQVAVFFDTKPGLRRNKVLRYSLDCVVSKTEEEE